MTCAIAPDGSVYPCAFLCDPAFLAGNVTVDPLSVIFDAAPVLEAFRDLEVEVAVGATVSVCATADVRRSGTSSPTPSAPRTRSVSVRSTALEVA